MCYNYLLMRFSGAYIARKIKRDLSSPELMTLLLAICLIIIFSLESIGLIGNCSHYSEIPLAHPSIASKISIDKLVDAQTVQNKYTHITKSLMKVTKEEKVSSLLLEAAENQILYELTQTKEKLACITKKEPIVDYAEDGEIFFFYV